MENRDITQNGSSTALLSAAIAVLGLWSIAATALFIYLDPADFAILGWALIGFIGVASIARPFPYAGLSALIIAVAVFYGLQYDRLVELTKTGLQLRDFYHVGAVVAAFAATCGIASLAGREINRLTQQLKESGKLIGELNARDPLTGALKANYGDKLLSIEIERARRYNRSVSLVIMEPDDWPSLLRHRGEDGVAEILQQTAKILIAALRAMDVIVYQGDARFALILPETTADGAQVLAHRLCRLLAEGVDVRFRAGVAEFPRDAVGKDELHNEASAALEFARSADVSVAGRSALI